MKEYYAVIERDENGELFGYFPQLAGCHTQGDDVPDLLKNLEEALSLYIEVNPHLADEPYSEFLGVHKFEVRK